jgi:putative ABC transport system ATP-binding protein
LSLSLDEVTYSYDGRRQVLRGIDVEVFSGEMLVVLGASGCGKTTLMNIMGMLENPGSGHVVFEGHDVSRLSQRALARVRRDAVGFVFQTYGLMPELTVAQNVGLAARMCGMRDVDVDGTLAAVGLEGMGSVKPARLSSGQQQRVSVARAVAKRPRLLLADEPTAALDFETSVEVLDVLRRVTDDGCALVMVTHNEEICRMADSVVRLSHGVIEERWSNDDPVEASELYW